MRKQLRAIDLPSPVVILAGSVAVVGSFLPWLDLSTKGISFSDGSVSGTAAGIDTVQGMAALIGGAVAVFVGVLLLFQSHALRLMASGLAVLAGVGMLAASALLASDVEGGFIDFGVREAASEDFPAADVREGLYQLFVQESVDVDAGIGVWLGLAGGALAVLGGGLGFTGLRRGRGEPPVEEEMGGAAFIPGFSEDEDMELSATEPGSGEASSSMPEAEPILGPDRSRDSSPSNDVEEWRQ